MEDILIEIRLIDLERLFKASSGTCDDCTNDGCNGCELWYSLHSTRKILELNGVYVTNL